MHANTARTVRPLLGVALCAVTAMVTAGCGEKADDSGAQIRNTQSAPQPGHRARQVADAWDGSKAAQQWHQGYYPMGEVVQSPKGGFHNEADSRAYGTGNFDLRASLPSAPRKDGRVTWERGASVTRQLIGAQEAFKALDRDSSPGPRLTVRGAKLGEMTLMTSRGPATIPAWLFTLEGYDTPLKRAAVEPSKLPEQPIKSVGQVATDALAPLGGLIKIAGSGRSVTVIATHGSCDNGPAVDVLETSGSVVLSAYTAGSKDGDCTSEMHGQELTVKLHRPVGSRVLLDAFTGRPVPYNRWPKTSQSWS
ncbi:hypothetical protein [Streptomyces sp. 5-10]|uniref:hypothetical protein n=1 Tax=Streptomyces sp. 5-10 TaxID=878925 RepID=UPI001CC30754|nr:hypothetical protein [Streptomyces sp. 5-10]